MNNAAPQTAPTGWKVTTAGRSLDVLSRQWMSRAADERFLSLDSLLDYTKARAEATSEIVIKPTDIAIISPEVHDDDTRADVLTKSQQLVFRTKDREVAPTNWAFGQIAQRAGAPAQYLRTLPTPIVADALQYGIRYNRADEMKLYADDLEALAITGPDYGRIFNWELAEAIKVVTERHTGDARWKVPGMLDWRTMVYDPHHPVTPDTTTLFCNDRGVFIFLCQDLAPIEIGKLPNGEPDLVFRGFYVTNSEVGAGSLKLGAMYLRAVCCNRILWGVESFEEITMRHTKYAPQRFIEEAQPALRSFAEGSTQKLIAGIEQAREAVLAENKDAALAWLADRNIARKRALAIYDKIIQEERQGDETDRPISAWDMAQGMTAQAREEPNFDTRFEVEKEAGKLLDKIA